MKRHGRLHHNPFSSFIAVSSPVAGRLSLNSGDRTADCPKPAVLATSDCPKLGVFQRPLTLILLQKYRDTNGSRIVIQIGGVHTTFSQEEGILLQKYRDLSGTGTSRESIRANHSQLKPLFL